LSHSRLFKQTLQIAVR